ncbi:hypothetical protein QJS66_10655 [Kocuria rhizophila]|nr:hypothetical protein QJS66_10655 [Kocuria rhizophila]
MSHLAAVSDGPRGAHGLPRRPAHGGRPAQSGAPGPGPTPAGKSAHPSAPRGPAGVLPDKHPSAPPGRDVARCLPWAGSVTGGVQPVPPQVARTSTTVWPALAPPPLVDAAGGGADPSASSWS